MNSLNDFDLGPLTWVKGEIDVACNAGIAALQAWNGEDLTPLKQALTYLHQVSGAIQIVGLQGVHQLGSAIEGLLADMQSRADLRNADSAALAVRAVQALQGYLDNLMAGAANAELALMPIYGEVQIRRGAEAPPPSELFYPDTGLRARRPGGEPALDDGERGRAMRQVRSKYQKGLLRYLQNQDAAAGLAAMAEAVRELQALVPGAAQYTFWWTAEAMLEALAADGAAPDAWLKRLLGRLDLQMRRLAEGARQLADSLFRDVLYCLLRTPGGGERADAVRELFELERYRPAAWSGVDEQRAEALRPMLGRLREVLNAAKDHWLHLCSGRKDSLDPLRASVAQIGDSAGRIGDPALSTLADAIRQVIAGHADEAAQNEALQVEMATAMLLLQHGAENYFKLGQDFGSHAEVQAGRLRAAVSGEAPLVAAPGEPLLDEIARQAQEKLLLAQVTREIQSNLNQIEEILDKFFRNQQDRGSLPLVPSLLKQVQGALSILQLEPAVELVRVVTDRVGLISEADHAIVPDELNWIAEAVSTLGLYVEALRNGRDDPAGLIRLLHPEAEAEPAETSVEEHLAALKEGLVATVDRLAEGGEADTLRGELRADLQRIAQDADLVGDAALRGQADEVRRLLDDNAATDTVRVATHALAGYPCRLRSSPRRPPPRRRRAPRRSTASFWRSTWRRPRRFSPAWPSAWPACANRPRPTTTSSTSGAVSIP
ncbi:hypothetical protein EZJ19_04485 [Parasulfuritortus cantonensis]|uniref:Scaffold protein FimL second domain-containing protein n=1 Tax=Parasulfuritortus cantonensis TaxID=2528202 RepID=A0A4R1BIW7_9PROT|nr:hypothetical protein [Parasulfuritortus cantonensis]TCJ17214.1 hypothetical protein EZJ19_04485 [Parasulfuritortus cantonensis]